MPAAPASRRQASTPGNTKPVLNMSNAADPSQWLNFSLPPRRPPGPTALPRRSRRADGWRGGVLSRERFVQANFRFVLKPTETLSYGAHFADPDISLHWPHILQVLVPTFSAYSVAQGLVSSDPSSSHTHDEVELSGSLDEAELEGMGEEDAERRRRMEEERRGRMCPICLGKPVAGRMTKCGHIFCFPCILHFIQLSDVPKSAKCPICGDTVHEGMLKSVKYLDAGTMLRSAAGDDGDNVVDAHRPSHGASHTPIGHPVQTDGQILDVARPHPRAPEHAEEAMVGEMDGFPEAQAGRIDDEEARDIEEHHGHRIHMRLVQRPQMTTLALPASATWPSEAAPPLTAPWYFIPDVLAYSRFMLASPEYMLGELQRELAELRSEWDLMRGDELGREFVRAAREKVERQVGKVQAELMTPLVRKDEMVSREAWADALGGEKKEQAKQRERTRRQREQEEKSKQHPPVSLDPSDVPSEILAAQDFSHLIPPNRPVEPNPMPPTASKKRRNKPIAPTPVTHTAPSPSYYFYQSSLGANVFLHPLDIRILLAHFKSYSLFPNEISFTSSGFDPGTINEELRKRCKYLSHLPAGTEVVFVEADLEPIVGREGLAAFDQPLKARRAKRRERMKREDRAKTKWEKQEREKLPAQVPTGEEREFQRALERSKVETIWPDPLPGAAGREDAGHFAVGSASSSSSHLLAYAHPGMLPSPGSSPSATWGSRPSFATTLGNAASYAHPPPATRREERVNEDVDAAWAAFENMSTTDADLDAEVDSGGGGGRKKGGRKGAKKVLVFSGGGGGRRA